MDMRLGLMPSTNPWGYAQGDFGGGAGWLDVFNTGLGVLGQYLGTRGGGAGSSMAGSMGPVYYAEPEAPIGTSPPDYPGADILPGDPMVRSLWRPTASGFRQIPTLTVQSPTGKYGFWKAMGRPLLFSGDLAACKRVARVASRAARRSGRRGGR